MSALELVELSPLKSTTLLWRPKEGALVLTVITKATYELKPGLAPLAEAQDDVNERDLHAQNDPSLGLYSASDLAPYKTQADVTVAGKAFAPPGELARALVARLKVGTVDKRIEVHAERYMRRDGRVRDNKFFSKMALGYERAPGGHHTNNPVGMDLTEQPDGRIMLPNLQLVGESPTLDEPLTPCGLGPLAAAWPPRQRMLNEAQRIWLEQDWSHDPVPAQMNWDFFNVAPRDQRLAEIAPDETIVLEHLHPEEAKLEMKLPGMAPRVYVERKSGAQRICMKGDTLWIDTNRLRCTLAWRGTMALDREQDLSRVIVAMVEPGKDLSWEAVWHMAEARRHQEEPSSGPQSQAAPMSVSEEKTRIRPPKARENSVPENRQKTAPVPLEQQADHTPAWLPTPGLHEHPSSPHGSPHSSMAPPSMGPQSLSPRSMATPTHPLVVEVAFSAEEAKMMKDLCQAMGYDTVQMVRHVLREAHQVRFSQPRASDPGPSQPQASEPGNSHPQASHPQASQPQAAGQPARRPGTVFEPDVE